MFIDLLLQVPGSSEQYPGHTTAEHTHIRLRQDSLQCDSAAAVGWPSLVSPRLFPPPTVLQFGSDREKGKKKKKEVTAPP